MTRVVTKVVNIFRVKDVWDAVTIDKHAKMVDEVQVYGCNSSFAAASAANAALRALGYSNVVFQLEKHTKVVKLKASKRKSKRKK